MKYYAKIVRDAEGYHQVSFPDLAGCFTYGETQKDALKNAAEALNCWLDACCAQKDKAPLPKARRGRNYYGISVDPQIALPVALRQLRALRRVSQAQVAKKLGMTPKKYAEFELPLKASTPFSQIKKIIDTLGIEIHFDLAS